MRIRAWDKQRAQQSLRIIHGAFVLMMAVQLALLLYVRKPAATPPTDVVTAALLGMALVEAAVVLFLRFNMLASADEEAAAIDGFYPKRQVLYVVAFALCESVWLLTWVLAFLGAPLAVAWSGFGVALALMFFCFPKRI